MKSLSKSSSKLIWFLASLYLLVVVTLFWTEMRTALIWLLSLSRRSQYDLAFILYALPRFVSLLAVMIGLYGWIKKKTWGWIIIFSHALVMIAQSLISVALLSMGLGFTGKFLLLLSAVINNWFFWVTLGVLNLKVIKESFNLQEQKNIWKKVVVTALSWLVLYYLLVGGGVQIFEMYS